MSSRENDYRLGYVVDQELDVLAPGSWVRGPFPGTPGYNHFPWWAPGMGWNAVPPNLVNFYYVGGTSMSTSHVSAVVALMLEKNPTLDQATVESILKSTVLPMPQYTSMVVWDRIIPPPPVLPYWGWVTMSWSGPETTGAGLLQADAAVATTPP